MVPAVAVAQERFRPLRAPFHRPSQLAGRPDDRRLFRVDEDLRAEPAADIRRHYSELRLRGDLHEGREHQPLEVRVLRSHVERVIAGRRIEATQRRARLHGIRDQAVVDDVERGDVGGAVEGGLRRRPVAEFPVIAEVVRCGLVELVGAGRPRHVDHGRQFVEVHAHRLGSVARRLRRFRDDDPVWLAHVVDALYRERRVRRLDHVRAVPRLHQPAAWQVADAVGRQIRAGVDRKHAGHRKGRTRIDRAHLRPRMGRAQKDRMGLSGLIDVVGVAAPARDEAEIFLAPDRGADACLGHESPLTWPCCRAPSARRARYCGSRCSGTGCLRVLRARRLRQDRRRSAPARSRP